MSMHTNGPEVVVVGAGLAGLTAGALAARAGARTTVLEAHQPGGRAQTEDHRGFGLNRGAHALYLGGAAHRILGELGFDPPGGTPLYGGAVLWRDGRAERLPAGVGSFLRTGALDRGSKVQVPRVATAIARLDPATVADRTYAELLDSWRIPADLRIVLDVFTRTASFTSALDQLSADAGVVQLRAAVRGVRYLDGGWQRLVDGLRQAVVAAGGSVVAGAPVSGLERAGGRWIVGTGDREVSADAGVLAAGGPAATASLLPEQPDWVLGPDVEVACLDIGITDTHPVRHTVVMSADDPLFLSTHAPPTDLAPAGHRLITMMRYLRPGERPPADQLRAELWGLAARAGIAPDDTVMQRYLHRMTACASMPVPATGGLAGRPGVAVDGHEGLFVAGDWVGPEGVLADAAMASAAAAARAAVAHRAPAVA
jgi:phytoene dehydrogenase-like protein